MKGGLKKPQDNESLFKDTPLIWAIMGQKNESYRGGVGPLKKEKFLLFEKFPTEGVGGLERLGWFPYFYQFLFITSRKICDQIYLGFFGPPH